jgi:hypothetical protein
MHRLNFEMQQKFHHIHFLSLDDYANHLAKKTIKYNLLQFEYIFFSILFDELHLEGLHFVVPVL